ncbi:exocyst complex component EXO70B1-like [Nymphaea colorata]|uniref:Exocyst subunit Exo70 family protein n=1 Tax=Nymphaea colorata TaxID=210225 RepID=A0A5K1BHP6_9MAGN|nr:exocyst complex component EXO70B1-like [Nymphaea colorata]
MAAVEGDERVIATAQQIVKSLGTTKNATKDIIMILSSFDNRLSTMTDLLASSGAGEMEERLDAAEAKVMQWDLNLETGRQCFLWDDFPDEARDFLSAVDEVSGLTESLGKLSLASEEERDLLDRAQSVLQVAMDRLEDEFRHVLIRKTVPLDADRLSGSTSIRRDDEGGSEYSGGGGDHDCGGSEEIDAADRSEYACDEGPLSLELIRPEAIPGLRDIAHRMVNSGYAGECCQVYSSIRRDVLEECLSILGVDKLSIDDVQKMEWNPLDGKIRRWIQAMKITVGDIFSGEHRLCEQIFGELGGDVREVCFVETAKSAVLQLLNFGEAVAIGRRSPEKLSRILDMYDALAEALPDLQFLFSGEAGEALVEEAMSLLVSLGDAAKGTFAEFENAIRREASRTPIQGGAIHPLVRYVMNYLKLLVDYSDTLNVLMEDDTINVPEEDEEIRYLGSNSPMARRLFSLTSLLEANVVEKSKLYKDKAMQFVFLMNNLLYIVQRVKDSELSGLLGDRWVKKRRGQVRQYATGYLRASWNKVLLCLKDEGIGSGLGGSSSGGAVSKVALKERFKNFNLGFEEIYRNQTAWNVPDPQLSEELRISISEKVIPAYRSFMGRFRSHLESSRHADKYIKYTPEDLENYLLDLFEGVPATLSHPRRKSS